MSSPALIFDADAHVTEPADVWTARMSRKKWGDLVPHVREVDGVESWFIGAENVGRVASSSFIRVDPRTGERYRQPPTGEFFSGAGYRELHPSSYDALARLEAMDELGVHAAAMYPNLNLVVNDLHEAVNDPAYKIDIIRSYNDWLVEWTSVAPERLIPLALVAYFDPNVAAEEIYRCKELGHRGLVMTGMPQVHGLPPLADESWVPLWDAAEQAGLSISFHVGANAKTMAKYVNPQRLAAEGALKMGARTITEALFDNACVLNDLLISGVLPRHPNLKFVIVETGMGWVNFCLDSADYHFERYGVGVAAPEFTEPPSCYFKRQCYTTYWFERVYPFYVDHVGAGNIMFETDYPHSTCLDPSDVKWVVEEGLAETSPEARDRILWRNGAELYGVEPPPAPTGPASGEPTATTVR